jgi:hypothetical protein
MVGLAVLLFKIHHRSFWEVRAGISVVAKLANMVREVVQEFCLQKVEIQCVDKMIYNF